MDLSLYSFVLWQNISTRSGTNHLRLCIVPTCFCIYNNSDKWCPFSTKICLAIKCNKVLGKSSAMDPSCCSNDDKAMLLKGLLLRITESLAGKNLQISSSQVQPSTWSTKSHHSTMSLSAIFTHLLNTSRDGDSTASLGSLLLSH